MSHDGAGGMRWLLTYSDLVTLLLVFFIVCYAMSNADANKMEALSQSIANAFTPFWSDKPFPYMGQGSGKGTRAPGGSGQEQGAPSISQQLQEAVKLLDKQAGLVRTYSGSLAIDLRFPDMFEEDLVTLKPEAKPFLKTVAGIFSIFNSQVEIAVYRRVMPPGDLRNVWTLTSDEASTIARYLTADCNVDSTMISATGLGPNYKKIGLDETTSDTDAGVCLVVLQQKTTKNN